jgi:hypothetical protein
MTQRHGGRFLVGDRVAREAAVLASIGFAGIAIFQLRLAAGAPWGHAAWGGANATSQRPCEAQAQVRFSSMRPPRGSCSALLRSF